LRLFCLLHAAAATSRLASTALLHAGGRPSNQTNNFEDDNTIKKPSIRGVVNHQETPNQRHHHQRHQNITGPAPSVAPEHHWYCVPGGTRTSLVLRHHHLQRQTVDHQVGRWLEAWDQSKLTITRFLLDNKAKREQPTWPRTREQQPNPSERVSVALDWYLSSEGNDHNKEDFLRRQPGRFGTKGRRLDSMM